MRLIDADALQEELRNSWIRKAKMPMEADPFLAFAMNDIDNAPTIDAEPVKHGEWKKVKGADGGYTDFRCSNCRRYRFHNGEMLKKYLYCPNCGAKMYKEIEDNGTE